MSLAICIISHDQRRDKLEGVYRSVLFQNPDEVIITADTSEFGNWFQGHRWLQVSPVTSTTVDALIKRDVGWMASKSDYICYLADDHTLGPGFVETFRKKYEGGDWDILCPQRFCLWGGQQISLNVGQAELYVGGHCGIYRRAVNRLLPWMAGSHLRIWDLLQTHAQTASGFRLAYANEDLRVQDMEPEAQPWR